MSNKDKKVEYRGLPESGEPALHSIRPELVVGLVGPIGTDLKKLFRSLKEVLNQFEYSSDLVHLSKMIEIIKGLDVELRTDNEYYRIQTKMKAGSRLREKTKRGDFLGMMAIKGIWDKRLEHRVSCGEVFSSEVEKYEALSQPIENKAYIIRSIKHPDEAKLLRRIYGGGFVLISAYAPKEERYSEIKRGLQSIKKESFNDNDPERSLSVEALAGNLISIDEKEEVAGVYGQRVSDAFPLADLFVDTRKQKTMRESLKRFFDSFFGYPFNTPTQDESGMYLAKSSAFKSLDMSRQVGAAIIDENGSVIGLGHNDVPRSGGGVYCSDERDDGRDFAAGKDYSVLFKHEIVKEIIRGLGQNGYLSDKWESDPDKLSDHLTIGRGQHIWADLTVNNLLEFGRPLHAEMSAILDAHSKGVKVKNATLYCTTFPCHLCARLIIGSGISRIVYIEPYHKSQTEYMYSDSVEVDPKSPVDGKVNFQPFVGISPQQYRKIFSWDGKRRDIKGDPKSWSEKHGKPKIKRYVNTYINLEAKVIDNIEEILNRNDLSWES